MGQKIHPYGFRLGYTTDWKSRWFASGKEYTENVIQDSKIRTYLKKELSHAAVSRIEIERSGDKIRIDLYTARPGIVIGQKGRGAEVLRGKVAKMMNLSLNLVHLTIEEVKKPEYDARLVAQKDKFAKTKNAEERK